MTALPPDGLVLAARDEGDSGRVDGDGVDIGPVPPEGLHAARHPQVPHPGSPVMHSVTRSIRRFVITEKAPTRAFSWLKVATTAFTFKTLLSKTLC